MGLPPHLASTGSDPFHNLEGHRPPLLRVAAMAAAHRCWPPLTPPYGTAARRLNGGALTLERTCSPVSGLAGGAASISHNWDLVLSDLGSRPGEEKMWARVMEAATDWVSVCPMNALARLMKIEGQRHFVSARGPSGEKWWPKSWVCSLDSSVWALRIAAQAFAKAYGLLNWAGWFSEFWIGPSSHRRSVLP
jgi:hypothetical protein